MPKPLRGICELPLGCLGLVPEETGTRRAVCAVGNVIVSAINTIFYYFSQLNHCVRLLFPVREDRMRGRYKYLLAVRMLIPPGFINYIDPGYGVGKHVERKYREYFRGWE